MVVGIGAVVDPDAVAYRRMNERESLVFIVGVNDDANVSHATLAVSSGEENEIAGTEVALFHFYAILELIAGSCADIISELIVDIARETGTVEI